MKRVVFGLVVASLVAVGVVWATPEEDPLSDRTRCLRQSRKHRRRLRRLVCTCQCRATNQHDIQRQLCCSFQG